MLHLRHALPGSSLGWWSSRFSCGVWLLQCRGLVALIRWGPWFLGWKVRNVRNARNNKTPTKDEIFFLEGWWRTVYSFGEVALETLNEGSLFCVVCPVCKCRVVPDWRDNKIMPRILVGTSIFTKKQPSVWTGGFWKLSVNRTENPAWKWARLPTGEPPQWHHDFNSQKSFPFSSRIFPSKKKNSVSEFARNEPSSRPTKNSLHLNR